MKVPLLLPIVAFLFGFLSLFTPVQAQVNNDLFQSSVPVLLDSGKTVQRMEILTYLRNTEYYHPIEQGQTWLGAQVRSEWNFGITPTTHAELGVWWSNSFGSTERSFRPLVAIVYKPLQWEWRMGTLQGGTQHRLIEPLYEISRMAENPLEYGLQARRLGTYSFVDVWLEWQKAIQVGSPYKEVFQAGWVMEQSIRKSNLSLYAQGLWTHHGGQVDTAPDSVYQGNRLNGALGWKYSGKIEAQMAWVGYADPLSAYTSIQKGNGWMVHANGKWERSKKGTLRYGVTFWQGHRFLAPGGGQIYQSYNATLTHYEPKRSFFIPRITWDAQRYSLRFEPLIDPTFHTIDPVFSYYYRFQMIK